MPVRCKKALTKKSMYFMLISIKNQSMKGRKDIEGKISAGQVIY